MEAVSILKSTFSALRADQSVVDLSKNAKDFLFKNNLNGTEISRAQA